MNLLERQAATLETLSNPLHKGKSRLYDRRRLNGSRSFGRRMAESRRSQAVEGDSAAKALEAEQAAAEAEAQRVIERLHEISRTRSRYGSY
jgi:hypothetical protein